MVKKLTIEDMQKLAESRGGMCLSKKYIGALNKLKWQCVKGHVWKATPGSVKYRSWCPICAIENMKLTIEDMQKLAESRGGKCMSKKYINNYTQLKWQCSEGHIWKAKPDNIKTGTWCPKCSRKNKNIRINNYIM